MRTHPLIINLDNDNYQNTYFIILLKYYLFGD
jgi:hypothetical protein